MLANVGVHLKLLIAGRVDFQRNLPVAQQCQQIGVFDGANAVADAVGLQGVNRSPNAACSHRFPSVGDTEQPGFLGGGKGMGKWFRRCAHFVATQPKTNHAHIPPLQGKLQRFFGWGGVVATVWGAIGIAEAEVARAVKDPAHFYAKFVAGA